ncbi:hypothetical protein LOD99_4482 [Oopsacas minuta]|uniref:Uncharacterized protein n=1 Tax=Oopsacas minuta TaxID=111878 RepID=A0AAV7JVP6_9METZ|nr:hypothetical protein LOD99_4482 [Oopsacas minuta]
MAELYPEIPLVMNPTEARINQLFDHLVICLNRRRVKLISEFRERQKEKSTALSESDRTISQLQESKASIQTQMKENMLQSMRERMIEDIDAKLKELRVTVRETEVLFQCETQQIEESIFVLGQLIEREIISPPNYPALLQPSISAGNRGTAEGELDFARGIAFNENTQLIYVAHGSNSGRISVFSVTGEFIKTVCEGIFRYPRGIAISGEDVYISDVLFHCIFHYKLPNFRLVTGVGKEGKGKEEFNSPSGLTVSTDRSVFVADLDNHRIVVMDANLKHQKFITHDTMTAPQDVKLLDDSIYVLSSKDNHCLHVFSPAGEKLRSFITCNQ